jgi:mRNA interferase MazF
VVVALQGDSGKPRPAVIVQADWFDALPTVVVLPLTSSLQDAPVTRIDVAPSDENGLRIPSQIAIDRPQTVRRPKLGPTIGRLDNDVMLAVQRALAVFLGLA